MNISFNEVEKIFKTLPIGYYVKRNVKCTLHNDSKSFYNPMNDEIFVSFPMIETAVAKLEETENIEEIIRGLLYHEVSHAFITPKDLNVTKARNIVEDERIESVLRKYYFGVNFRKLVKQINDYHGEKPKTADEAFYQLVRYRIGSPKWLERLHNLIMAYRNLGKNDYAWTYSNDIDRFYNEFVEEYKREEEEKEKETSKPDASDEMNEDTSEDTSEESNEDDSEDECDDYEEETDDAFEDTAKEPTDDEESEFNKEIADRLIEQTTDVFADPAMQEQINSILQNLSKASKRNGSAINAYSGVFDARSVVRDDYKFFVQKNREGHVKAFSKVHLNLFIDRSGSFGRSEKTVNKLLFALKKFELANPNFEFDLVTCGMGERLESKDNRKLKTGGGNDLDSNIFGLYNKLQLPGQMNLNIVLFDGDAFSDSSYRWDAYKNMGAFNHSNTTIISDDSNQFQIETYAPSAKHIFTIDYAKELCKNVMTALQNLGR